MRKVTAEDRELFLAALAGRLPAKTVRAVAKAVARIAVKHAPPDAKPSKSAKLPTRRRATDEEVLQFLEAIGLRTKPAPTPIIAPPKPPLPWFQAASCAAVSTPDQ